MSHITFIWWLAGLKSKLSENIQTFPTGMNISIFKAIFHGYLAVLCFRSIVYKKLIEPNVTRSEWNLGENMLLANSDPTPRDEQSNIQQIIYNMDQHMHKYR